MALIVPKDHFESIQYCNDHHHQMVDGPHTVSSHNRAWLLLYPTSQFISFKSETEFGGVLYHDLDDHTERACHWTGVSSPATSPFPPQSSKSAWYQQQLQQQCPSTSSAVPLTAKQPAQNERLHTLTALGPSSLQPPSTPVHECTSSCISSTYREGILILSPWLVSERGSVVVYIMVSTAGVH